MIVREKLDPVFAPAIAGEVERTFMKRFRDTLLISIELAGAGRFQD